MDVATVKKFTKFTTKEIQPQIENLLENYDISRKASGVSSSIKHLDKFVNERTIGKEHIYYYILDSIKDITSDLKETEKNAKIFAKNIKTIRKQYAEFMTQLEK